MTTDALTLPQLDVHVQGSGPALLLAHGAGGGIQGNFGLVLDDLARDHTLVGPHYPVAGGSPPSPPAPWTWTSSPTSWWPRPSRRARSRSPCSGSRWAVPWPSGSPPGIPSGSGRSSSPPASRSRTPSWRTPNGSSRRWRTRAGGTTRRASPSSRACPRRTWAPSIRPAWRRRSPRPGTRCRRARSTTSTWCPAWTCGPTWRGSPRPPWSWHPPATGWCCRRARTASRRASPAPGWSNCQARPTS